MGDCLRPPTLELIRRENGHKVYRCDCMELVVEKRFALDGVCGMGSYGTVCSAIDEEKETRVAIKYQEGIFDELNNARRVWREILLLRVLRECNCRNIIQLSYIQKPLKSIAHYNDVYFVTDFYQISLGSLIKKREMSASFIAGVIGCALCCLSDMHKLGFVHRDIKPGNILLRDGSDGLSTALCDFGFARGPLNELDLPMKMSDFVITRFYRPPEILFGSPYDYKVDVWSLGCVLAECFSRKALFPGKNYIHQLALILQMVPVSDTSFLSDAAKKFLQRLPSKENVFSLDSLPKNMPRACVDLLAKMLRFDPMSRISASDALYSPFFHGIDFGDPIQSNSSELFLPVGFDLQAEVSEAQVRRLIWDEIHRYHC